jgi:transposase, IS5 family
LKRVSPNQKATYVDKGYCTKPEKQAAARQQVHLAATKKINKKGRNQDLDYLISKIRAPYERVF